MNAELIQNTLMLLHAVERHATTPEQFEALEASRTLLHFILGRGEAGEFRDFHESFDTTPVTPLLAFATLKEAESWLMNHPAAPHGATIRAANDFYTVVDARALNHRKLQYGFEDYLESIRSARTSPPRASFATRKEADTWLETQPQPPPPTVVAIGNELYAAGYNRRRALRLLIRIPTPRELAPGAP